jgi:cell division protein FtsB
VSGSVPPEEFGSPGRTQKRLLLLAWASTIFPLIAFAYLTWQSYQLAQTATAARAQVSAARAELENLREQRATLEKQITETKATLALQGKITKQYRDVAGVRIQFYRESDRATVEKALEGLGYRVDTNLGASRLIDRSPNTIAYGSSVPVEDLRDIALALMRAGFPLKGITRAMVQPDPKLIQIFASARSDRECGLLTEALVRAGETCGPR